jgi:hypothetical protein
MDDVDVSRQLKQMMDFIRQEAVEKAAEIEIAAAEVPPPCPSAAHSLLEDYQISISHAIGQIRIEQVPICYGPRNVLWTERIGYGSDNAGVCVSLRV